jgi:RsiW-degrading membrane proteinase PrsW (M82 family)
LLAVACGAGFGLVEDAYIRHAAAWGQTIAVLPLTEVNGDRLVVGHAIWTAAAGGTLGIALLLLGRTARGGPSGRLDSSSRR